MADWYQETLLPPEIIEARIRIGVVPSSDHVQWQIELLDPLSGILTASESQPHATLTQLPEALADIMRRTLRLLDTAAGPF